MSGAWSIYVIALTVITVVGSLWLLAMTANCVRSQFIRGAGMPIVNSRNAKTGASCSERRWQ